jgi:hypothetical protein
MLTLRRNDFGGRKVNSVTLATHLSSQPNPRQSSLRRAFSFPAMLAVLLVGTILVPLRKFLVDPDAWWHIKVGATLLSTHRFPTTDPYSFTASGTPWIAYEWVGELLLGAVEGAWGIRGLMVVDLVLAAAILLALYAFATLRCGNSKAAFVACAALLPLVYLSVSLRPQMLGYLFLVLTLIVLERFRQGHTGALWLLPLLFLVWVNTHGSFILGLLALGVYWAAGLVDIHWGGLQSRLWTAGERLRLELAALLILLALTLTPYGPEVCLYPFNMAFSQPINVGNIQEWQPMMFGESFGKVFLALLIGFVVAQVTLRPTWRLEELVLFLVGTIAACLHMRFVLIFVPFSAPLLALILACGVPPYEPAKDKYALNAILMVLVVAAIVRFFPSQARLESQMEKRWPVKAVAYLKQHPAPRPMYNNYSYGGYLIWQLDGQNKVFIDGRADIYERVGVLADYLTISRVGHATPFLLDAYGIQSCLIEREEALATLLGASPGWQKIYGDQISVLYVRRPRGVESVNFRDDTSAEGSSRWGSSLGSSH